MKTGIPKTNLTDTTKARHLCAFDHSDHTRQAWAYQPLLKRIAGTLGLGEKEANTLAEDAIATAERRFADQNEGLTIRLWLSKYMIRNCIFRISSVMFSQDEKARSVCMVAGCCIPFFIRHLPLSFRTVYILVRYIGFSETEVAILLNSTRLQVRERLVKAEMKIAEAIAQSHTVKVSDE